jgi:hypothetical protein
MPISSVTFVLKLSKPVAPVWRKSFVAYFHDFDAKVFFTHHWGSGLASEAGVFSVFNLSTVNFGSAVHENTHTLVGENWGDSTSFLNEGLARYAEAAATAPERDHLATAMFINNAQLFPLADMIKAELGSDWIGWIKSRF